VFDRQQHWETVYGTKAADRVSWFRPHLETSLALVERYATDRDARVIDVGGGESTLVDDLVARGYGLTVLDISQTAIAATKARLGTEAGGVEWITSDITRAALPSGAYDVWHDRAVFHFLTAPEDRAAYVARVRQSLKRGGHLILATFGPDGPMKCSGLEVCRYDADSLRREFGEDFRLLESLTEVHHTPFGTMQQFLYCCFVLQG
jgi:2-polyprenyl-3-methyl-5-hydroxy-6-metoxy-1,4-benzoquinol methylase